MLEVVRQFRFLHIPKNIESKKCEKLFLKSLQSAKFENIPLVNNKTFFLNHDFWINKNLSL